MVTGVKVPLPNLFRGGYFLTYSSEGGGQKFFPVCVCVCRCVYVCVCPAVHTKDLSSLNQYPTNCLSEQDIFFFADKSLVALQCFTRPAVFCV